MPSHGVDIIDGIPVILKGTVMHAFQHGIVNPSATPLILGTYDPATKKATWSDASLDTWLAVYRGGLLAQSRK